MARLLLASLEAEAVVAELNKRYVLEVYWPKKWIGMLEGLTRDELTIVARVALNKRALLEKGGA